MEKLCPKGTRKSPCSGVVSESSCIWCVGTLTPSVYQRCEAHGGAAGAKRSLTAHLGICLAKVRKAGR